MDAMLLRLLLLPSLATTSMPAPYNLPRQPPTVSHHRRHDGPRPTARPVVTALINTSAVTHTVPAAMNGGHFSPLNHQVQVLLSSLLFDGSFEQTPLNGCSRDGGDRSTSAGLCECGSVGCTYTPPPPGCYGNFQNHSWVFAEGAGEYVVEPWCSSPETIAIIHQPSPSPSPSPPPPCALNGNVSFRMSGVGSRVANRGLYKQGFVVEPQATYSGYLFVRSPSPVKLLISMEDDGAALASATVEHGGGNWSRHNFTLVASRGTAACSGFPAGTPPLWCSCSEEECDTCIRCGGELAITLVSGDGNGDGDDGGGASVSADLDYVWLAPSPSTGQLLPGVPAVNRLPVELVRRMGHRMLRYGGTFSKCKVIF